MNKTNEDYLTLREIADALGQNLNTVRAAASDQPSRQCFPTIERRDQHGRPYKVAKLSDAKEHFDKRRK